MRRFSILGMMMVLPALTFMMAGSGCGKKDDPKKTTTGTVATDTTATPTTGGEVKQKGDSTSTAKGPVQPGDGIINGRIVLEGEMPILGKNLALLEHKDCKEAPGIQHSDMHWIIGKDKGVANVVVFLKPNPGSHFVISDGDKKRTDTVFVDQPFCAYEPRVVALFPKYKDGDDLKPTGQKFEVRNSAKFTHNTRWAGDSDAGNPEGSVQLAPNAKKDLELNPQKNPVSLACDYHKWMTAKVWVFDNPYFAVTKEDGSFEIKNVPTGVELRVYAWHEAKQFIMDGNKMTFKSGENPLNMKVSVK